MKEKRIAGASSLTRNTSATGLFPRWRREPHVNGCEGQRVSVDAQPCPPLLHAVRLCCMPSPTRPTFPLLRAAAAMISSKNTIRIKLVVIVQALACFEHNVK